MPPDTPQSTKPMPFGASSAAWPLVVGVARVAAVDDDVALVEQLGQGVDRVVGRLAGRDHHPHDAGRLEALDQRREAVDLARAVGRAVVADDRVPAAAQALRHVAAHAAQPDHAQRCHGSPSSR
jgi:hypothetical protein